MSLTEKIDNTPIKNGQPKVKEPLLYRAAQLIHEGYQGIQMVRSHPFKGKTSIKYWM